MLNSLAYALLSGVAVSQQVDNGLKAIWPQFKMVHEESLQEVRECLAAGLSSDPARPGEAISEENQAQL